MLEVANVQYRVKERTLLQGITVNIKPSAVTAIMGPNGAGKSTLLKIMSGELKAFAGEVRWFGQKINAHSNQDLAKVRAVLRQQYALTMPFTVYDIILMGRYPHFRHKPTLQCTRVIEEVSEYVGVTQYMDRNYLTLSGGEQQRVQLARVLAQVWDTQDANRLILLDEPVSALDIKYQHHLLDLVQDLTRRNFTIVVVLHDLNLAMQYADDVLLMKKGAIVESGNCHTVLDEQNIWNTFQVAVSLIHHKEAAYPFIATRMQRSHQESFHNHTRFIKN